MKHKQATWKEIVFVFVGVVLLLAVAGCSAAPVKPAFPDDMKLVCYEGQLVIGSASAEAVVPLPIRCSDT